MKTTLYLIRHGATAANLLSPPTLQGRYQDPPLADIGVRQAEITRDLLAIRPIDACYSSPLRRAVQTASIIAQPHGLRPKHVDALVEIDVGQWEGLDWGTIRKSDNKAYAQFMKNPARFGYPGGENFSEVGKRVENAVETILAEHQGQRILVVSHHVVNRIYLAHLLGIPPSGARRVSLDNCGISVVVREAQRTSVTMVNACLHLQGLAA
jgi:broad specificity phosphatase PhoE